MALTHGLDFALLYACVLALFSWLAFFLVPIATRVAYAKVKTWLAPHRYVDDDKPLWFDGHHSQ